MTTTTIGRANGLAPERSYQQRLDALAEANRIRSARKQLKARARRGEVDLIALLVAPPAEIETMKIFDLLVAMRKVGRVKANKVLVSAHVSPSKTIGGLTDRQRRELSDRVGAWSRA